MESNNYGWFITQTVEAMLPRFSGNDILLAMKLDASWTDFGYDDSGNEQIREESAFRKTMLLMFRRPMNYTQVFINEISQDDAKYRFLPIESIEFETRLAIDHDSCWREGSTDWIFKTFCEAWSFFEWYGIEGRKIDPSFHYSIFRGKPSYWKIKKLERTYPEEEERCRAYTVELDRQIHLKEISNFMVNAQE